MSFLKNLDKKTMILLIVGGIVLLLVLVFIVGGIFKTFNQEDKETTASNASAGQGVNPEDYQLPYYTDETTLPDNAFYIVKNETVWTDDEGNEVPQKTIREQTKIIKEELEKAGKTENVNTEIENRFKDKYTKNEVTRYYPALTGYETSIKEVQDNEAGFDPNRYIWTNYDYDDGLIPTMYQGDKLIYKSTTKIPEVYQFEKFFDNGYTLGVAGLVRDTTGNYKYVKQDGEFDDGGSKVLKTSDANGFDTVSAESIYLIKAEDEDITPRNMSLSGTVEDLKVMKKYNCDIRQGTQKINAKLTACAHFFSSAENYIYSQLKFITPEIAEIYVPPYAKTGYYAINGVGFIRYIKDPNIKDYTQLQTKDYNDTYYLYNQEGVVKKTEDGKYFSSDGYVTDDPKQAANESMYSDRNIFRKLSTNGYFEQKVAVQYVSEQKIDKSGNYYEIGGIGEDLNPLTLKYYSDKSKKDIDNEISGGKIYTVTFYKQKGEYSADSFTIKKINYIQDGNEYTLGYQPQLDE